MAENNAQAVGGGDGDDDDDDDDGPYLPDFDLVQQNFRTCEFQLATGDVAFLDFNKAEPNTLTLARASFDGHGCWSNVASLPQPNMDPEDASELLAMVAANAIDQPRCRKIVVKYLTANKDVMWEDALTEHGCLNYE